MDIAVLWSIANPATLRLKALCVPCVTVLHNSVELDSSMTNQNHPFSCSSSICGLWFILGNLLNSREEKGSSKEKFTAICILPICTFSFAWDWGGAALEEFHCDTLSCFGDLSPSHSLCLRESLPLVIIQKHVRNIPLYRRESWTENPAWLLWPPWQRNKWLRTGVVEINWE